MTDEWHEFDRYLRAARLRIEANRHFKCCGDDEQTELRGDG